ncbi:hypothetical protein I307_06025 [Cryptococcus deuterogattii 99/473]|uniref:RRM domain-containing protein n=1 Tax=Cryptococcus deuterogattii Ram5 TaxID=1296110 RepID=A0A0D0UVV5_9TREE|nr:hypothetical protein I309_05716 [Cryptococcus deuterogattii LA55]KIR39351.1 hypothetical protein I313_04952 [Cryptococcus deuterogattii Ram5]KIR94774.1 hypothetical protein I304_01093 [Cryptococcus deuterogattii CBS 10090]KIY54646.1 hypothetical protein I307_06025 [Cryptococcus deuterogattii 99/473]
MEHQQYFSQSEVDLGGAIYHGPDHTYPLYEGSGRAAYPTGKSEKSFSRKGGPNKRVFGLDSSVEEIDSVVLHDLHWWTSDRDLVELCSQLGVVIAEKDILFMEHKVNGKSKGQAVMNCHDKEDSLKVNDWLQCNAFQGKKVISTLAASIMGNPFHPNNQDFPAPRPLSSAIHNTMGQPTNSHGGVNFNRVNKPLRTSHQAGLGNGRPMNPWQNVNLQPSQASHQSQMPPRVHNQINMASLPLSNQSMIMGMFPMDPSIAWPIPVDFPLPEYGPHLLAPDYRMNGTLHTCL